MVVNRSHIAKVFRSLQSPVASSTLSVQSDDEDQSRCSLEGIEERRLSLIAASENLKNVVAESNFREDQGENRDDSDSLSMISNVYWNALYSSKSCEDHDQFFGALAQGVISDDEVECHEVDSDGKVGHEVFESEADLSDVDAEVDEINSSDLMESSDGDDSTAESLDATSSSKRKVEVPLSHKPFREIEDALAILSYKKIKYSNIYLSDVKPSCKKNSSLT